MASINNQIAFGAPLTQLHFKLHIRDQHIIYQDTKAHFSGAVDASLKRGQNMHLE
jgi:hypothetical protein